MGEGLIEVKCPCCDTNLKIDVATCAVITHHAPEKPKPIEDLVSAVEKLKGETGRREQVFERNVEAERSHSQVLSKKFDELLKQAKQDPDPRPLRNPFDLD